MPSATMPRSANATRKYCEPISAEFKPPTLPDTPLPGTELIAFQLRPARKEVVTLKRTPGLDDHASSHSSPRSYSMFERWLKTYPVSVWVALVTHYTGLTLGSDEEEASAWLLCDRRSDQWWLVDDQTAVAAVSRQRTPGSAGV